MIDKEIEEYEEVLSLLRENESMGLSDFGLADADRRNAEQRIAELQAERGKIVPSSSTNAESASSPASIGGDTCDIGRCASAKAEALSYASRLRSWSSGGSRGVHESSIANMCLMESGAKAMDVCALEAARAGNATCQRDSEMLAREYRANAAQSRQAAMSTSGNGSLGLSCASF